MESFSPKSLPISNLISHTTNNISFSRSSKNPQSHQLVGMNPTVIILPYST
ncbi:hypothetical protein Leryth_027582 [Lithospermum erythrorhizon]|nr:hypothetical protein Leryth_027582 [Lithospermum erythrorhizon]